MLSSTFWCRSSVIGAVCSVYFFTATCNATFTSTSSEKSSTSLIQPFERNDTMIKEFIDRWRIMCYDLEASVPSQSTAYSLTKFYEKIQNTISRESSTPPAKRVSFTVGRVQYNLSCDSRVVPWEVVDDITRSVAIWTRMGFLGFGTFVFSVARGTIIFLVVVQMVLVALVPIDPPLHYNIIN